MNAVLEYLVTCISEHAVSLQKLTEGETTDVLSWASRQMFAILAFDIVVLIELSKGARHQKLISKFADFLDEQSLGKLCNFCVK